MTFPNGGQRDEGNPNRQVGPNWQQGFMGKMVGFEPGEAGRGMGGHGYFSSEATGGGPTDTLRVPLAEGYGQAHVGGTYAVRPHQRGGDVTGGAKLSSGKGPWADPDNKYLPGFQG